MRILLTGGTGFLGRPVLEKLSGHEILLLTRDAAKVPPEIRGKVEILEGDLAELAKFDQALAAFDPECLVHLAWENGEDTSQKTCEKNRVLSTRLFNFIVDSTKCGRIVSIGTCREYSEPSGATRESGPTEVTSDLTQVKKQLLNCGMALANTCDVKFYWLRLFYVYGPRQRPISLVPALARRFKTDIPIEVRTPGSAHDFIYVADVADAIAAAVACAAPSGAYNIGSGTAVTVAEICGLVEEKICGHRLFTETLDGSVREKPPVYWADLAKSRDKMGWSPNTSLSEGLDLYLAEEKCGQLI